MNNATRIFLIILCILMIAIGAASIYFAASSVFAEGLDDITSDTIVNFNQQVVNTYTHGTLSQGGWYDLSSNVISGHDYYIKVICSNVGALNGFFFSYADHDEKRGADV